MSYDIPYHPILQCQVENCYERTVYVLEWGDHELTDVRYSCANERHVFHLARGVYETWHGVPAALFFNGSEVEDLLLLERITHLLEPELLQMKFDF